MRAKLVIESLKFERGLDPKIAMDIGNVEIRKLRKYLVSKILYKESPEEIDLIVDIIVFKNIYRGKINSDPISFKFTHMSVPTEINHLMSKTIYTLKELRHKWMKLSQNPDIKPGEIYVDFKS